MSKHTSGPWHVFSVYAQHEVRTATDTIVAACVARADARLIAAAPDLLHELYAAAAQIEALGGDARTQRAAVAKATGAQQ